MQLRYQDSFLISSVSDFEVIERDIKGKNLMIVVLGMLEDSDMDKEWQSYFHPSYVLSDDWITVYVRNESHGFISDLAESFAGKFFNDIAEAFFRTSLEHPARLLEHIITNRKNKDKKTVIVCHSQGGIITVNALNSCSKQDCRNIQIVFMGTANWTLPRHLRTSDCVCITTKLDYVSITCGRYFLPSTIKLHKYTTHSIDKYSRVMYSVSKQAAKDGFSKFNLDEFKKC